MKTVFIGEKERRDINSQVEKILRNLGNPEPPLKLEHVRELLRLDLRYYSSTDDSWLQDFGSRLKIAGKLLYENRTRLWDIVNKIGLKALWVPEPRRILLDKSVPEKKHRWNESHEIGHSILEWHGQFLYGDSEKELSLSCHEMLEAEANYAAGQLLFLRDRFQLEAQNYVQCMDSVKELKGTYGNTWTSTLWRFVEETGDSVPMLGLVTCHPRRLPGDHDASAPVKYFIESPAFRRKFETVSEVAIFEAMMAYCRNARGGCLGEKELILRDVNGDAHVFLFETHFNTFEALTLAVYKRKHQLIVPVPALIAEGDPF
jgi:hypothetical protein